jgi:hypothetical protein
MVKGHPLVKKTWLQRAVDTYNFHCCKLKEKPRWTQKDTADALGRSSGSISEDMLIASWLRTHEDKIKSFKYAKDCLAFIREKENARMEEIKLA